MSRKRIRPKREEFADLCAKHTRAEIAKLFGVTHMSVVQWEKVHEVRALPGRSGRPASQEAPKAAPAVQPRHAESFNALRPRVQRPTNLVTGPRTGITAPSDRTPKDDYRDQLAADVERYLASGGEIEALPGCGNAPHRRAFQGGIL